MSDFQIGFILGIIISGAGTIFMIKLAIRKKRGKLWSMNCPVCGNTGKIYVNLSRAELAEIVGGDSWVLKELEKFLEGKVDSHLVGIKNVIRQLRSQAPVSDIGKEIEENEKRARAWKKLYADVKDYCKEVNQQFAYVIDSNEMDELLEESDEQG
jgi:hypothetical protein